MWEPWTLIPQCFAEPENFSVNILDFRFFLDLLDFSDVFFVRNQLIWQHPFDNSYTQHLFLPRYNFVS